MDDYCTLPLDGHVDMIMQDGECTCGASITWLTNDIAALFDKVEV